MVLAAPPLGQGHLIRHGLYVAKTRLKPNFVMLRTNLFGADLAAVRT